MKQTRLAITLIIALSCAAASSLLSADPASARNAYDTGYGGNGGDSENPYDTGKPIFTPTPGQAPSFSGAGGTSLPTPANTSGTTKSGIGRFLKHTANGAKTLIEAQNHGGYYDSNPQPAFQGRTPVQYVRTILDHNKVVLPMPPSEPDGPQNYPNPIKPAQLPGYTQGLAADAQQCLQLLRSDFPLPAEGDEAQQFAVHSFAASASAGMQPRIHYSW